MQKKTVHLVGTSSQSKISDAKIDNLFKKIREFQEQNQKYLIGTSITYQEKKEPKIIKIATTTSY